MDLPAFERSLLRGIATNRGEPGPRSRAPGDLENGLEIQDEKVRIVTYLGLYFESLIGL